MMPSEPPSEDLIRYDVMVQEALLDVVRKVLQDAARHGLPGEHHFYITFRSQAPGVRLSSRLKEKYPEEMTVVLQHQFWDLIVSEHQFEVGLAFGGVPERLLVPFEALTGFYDPSVQFGLKFTPDETQADNDMGDGGDPSSVRERLTALAARDLSGREKAGAVPAPRGGPPQPALPAKAGTDPKPEPGRPAAAKTEPAAPVAPKPGSTPAAEPATSSARKPRSKPLAGEAAAASEAAGEAGKSAGGAKSANGAEVVSLESFRKKK